MFDIESLALALDALEVALAPAPAAALAAAVAPLLMARPLPRTAAVLRFLAPAATVALVRRAPPPLPTCGVAVPLIR